MHQRAMPVIVAMKPRAWRMSRLLWLVPGVTDAGLRLVDGSIRAAGDRSPLGSGSERAWTCGVSGLAVTKRGSRRRFSTALRMTHTPVNRVGDEPFEAQGHQMITQALEIG